MLTCCVPLCIASRRVCCRRCQRHDGSSAAGCCRADGRCDCRGAAGGAAGRSSHQEQRRAPGGEIIKLQQAIRSSSLLCMASQSSFAPLVTRKNVFGVFGARVKQQLGACWRCWHCACIRPGKRGQMLSREHHVSCKLNVLEELPDAAAIRSSDERQEVRFEAAAGRALRGPLWLPAWWCSDWSRYWSYCCPARVGNHSRPTVIAYPCRTAVS